MNEKAQHLAALKQTCAACTKCALCEGRTNTVFGTGPLTAEVMVVGEGPGQNEDEQGQPFVGRSGTLLDTYLNSVGFSRQENVYITNIVKCRPPGNRDPKTEEREICLPYLREQYKILRPKIVICLGRIAAQCLIRPDFAVTREHGTFTEKGGVFFMGTFHPAALLRNPNNKPAAFNDFAALREKALKLGIL
ncbi:uracil-DNA glycosylase [Ruminococcaceae bacterium OttesenSCG-928-N02]|nr:uracil-DNA glycosylase [Ruminococcaceae bacterium OttesenSCG-928-N02]